MSCLYTSCAYHLKTDHVSLRRSVSLFINEHMDLPINGTTLREWIIMAGHNPEKYAQKVARPSVMGTGIEVAVIALLHNRAVIVFNPQGDKIAEYFPELGNAIELIFMGPPDGGHYEPKKK